jgi:uncharacterized repeat protein (TIGR04076 family)
MNFEQKWKENDEWWKPRQVATYKIVLTVKETPDPKPIGGQSLHVTWPCPIYKVGDRMTFDPHKIILEETDSVCFNVLEGIQPLLKRYRMGPLEKKDEPIHPDFKYVRCTDSERPVLFEVTRIPFDASKDYPSWGIPSERPNRDLYYKLYPSMAEWSKGHNGELKEAK